MVNLQQVINSSLGLRIVSILAQALPPQWGYRVGDFIGEQIAQRRRSRLVEAMRLNQWVVSDKCLDGEALDRAVRETLRYAGRCFYDLYHYLESPAAIRQLVVLEPTLEPLLERPELDRRGLIAVGVHLSNFDLILQWLCRERIKPLVLTIPNPEGGRRLEYEIRRKSGMNLIPASVSALRQAVKHLQRGGVVVTGIDRPIPEAKVRPRFFGYPASLPVHHIFLATKAGVPVILAAASIQADGKYHVFASDLIKMDSYPNEEIGLLRNAEKVLNIAEAFIRRAPQQWSVPLPVWPEIMDLVPK